MVSLEDTEETSLRLEDISGGKELEDIHLEAKAEPYQRVSSYSIRQAASVGLLGQPLQKGDRLSYSRCELQHRASWGDC